MARATKIVRCEEGTTVNKGSCVLAILALGIGCGDGDLPAEALEFAASGLRFQEVSFAARTVERAGNVVAEAAFEFRPGKNGKGTVTVVVDGKAVEIDPDVVENPEDACLMLSVVLDELHEEAAPNDIEKAVRAFRRIREDYLNCFDVLRRSRVVYEAAPLADRIIASYRKSIADLYERWKENPVQKGTLYLELCRVVFEDDDVAHRLKDGQVRALACP